MLYVLEITYLIIPLMVETRYIIILKSSILNNPFRSIIECIWPILGGLGLSKQC